MILFDDGDKKVLAKSSVVQMVRALYIRSCLYYLFVVLAKGGIRSDGAH